MWPAVLGGPKPSGLCAAQIGCGLLEQLDLLLRQLAEREGARIIVFKEFSEEERAAMDGLVTRGYVRGDSPPMYELEKPFADFEEYRAALKTHYRTKINTAQRRVRHRGLPIRASDEPPRYSTRLYARGPPPLRSGRGEFQDQTRSAVAPLLS